MKPSLEEIAIALLRELYPDHMYHAVGCLDCFERVELITDALRRVWDDGYKTDR